MKASCHNMSVSKSSDNNIQNGTTLYINLHKKHREKEKDKDMCIHVQYPHTYIHIGRSKQTNKQTNKLMDGVTN